MTKTNKEWLSELPEPYRTEALENLEEHPWIGTEEEGSWSAGAISCAISCAFWWSCTQQGFSYWSDIHARAIAGEFDRKQTTMKKQTKKRVKKPTQLDRIEADQKLILSKLATLDAYEKMVWDIRCVRPATPEEIAAAEAKEKERAEAQKLAKLKFGVKVRTWNGEGVYWYSSHIGKDEHRVVFHDSGVLVLKLSDITIIE